MPNAPSQTVLVAEESGDSHEHSPATVADIGHRVLTTLNGSKSTRIDDAASAVILDEAQRLREQASELLARAAQTEDSEERRTLHRRAFELAQKAECLTAMSGTNVDDAREGA